jgi:hypothetical protein
MSIGTRASPALVALAGAALITSGLWLKACAEERFLMVELGPDDYAAYCLATAVIEVDQRRPR